MWWFLVDAEDIVCQELFFNRECVAVWVGGYCEACGDQMRYVRHWHWKDAGALSVFVKLKCRPKYEGGLRSGIC